MSTHAVEARGRATETTPAPEPPRREGIPGTGLPLWVFALVVLLSIVLFLLWGQPIWRAPREASHVMRFVASYFAVIPAAAVALLAMRRFSWDRLVTSTGTSWAIKLVITALLYEAFARGTASQVEAISPAKGASSRPLVVRGYQPATGSFASGTVRGAVRAVTHVSSPAIAFVESPPSGAASVEASKVEVHFAGMRLAEPVILAHEGDALLLSNADPVLHTLRFTREGRAAANEPIPAGSPPHSIAVPDAGVYELRCANHSGERGWLVVVDHPYATSVDATGAFALDRVPAGQRRIVVVTAGGPITKTVVVPPGTSIDLTYDLDVD